MNTLIFPYQLIKLLVTLTHPKSPLALCTTARWLYRLFKEFPDTNSRQKPPPPSLTPKQKLKVQHPPGRWKSILKTILLNPTPFRGQCEFTEFSLVDFSSLIYWSMNIVVRQQCHQSYLALCWIKSGWHEIASMVMNKIALVFAAIILLLRWWVNVDISANDNIH